MKSLSENLEFSFVTPLKKKPKPEPAEYKVIALHETPLPEKMQLVDTPDRAADYWNAVIVHADWYSGEVECLVCLILNTRRKVKGHYLVSIGTMDTILSHAREVFRTAIMKSASALILMHNHPSGDSTPSEADVRITRDLIKAGQLLKIEVLDHVIVGKGQKCSLRELGYFYS